MTSKQKIEVICVVPTQVVCTAFSSHILVVMKQLGKMGTLFSLEPSNVASDICKPLLTIKVLLRQENPLSHVFAKTSGDICVSGSFKWSSLSCHGHKEQKDGGAEGLKGGDSDMPNMVSMELAATLEAQ